MRFLRTLFTGEGVLSCAQAAVQADGTRLSVAGVVLVRQRPGNGNVVFCTIEDETGIANIVVWSSLLDRFRRAILGSSLLQVTGRLQRSPEGIIHVVADRLDDRSAMMARITEAPPDRREALRCEAPVIPARSGFFPAPGTSTDRKPLPTCEPAHIAVIRGQQSCLFRLRSGETVNEPRAGRAWAVPDLSVRSERHR